MDPGPVEYIVIEFPGNRFNGDIAPAIADLVERDVVRILDLVFVKKDADGSVTSFEYDELDETAGFATIDGDADGLLGEDDVAEIAAGLAPESSALFILWEDLWARELGQAVWAAGGELVTGGRLGRNLVLEAFAAADTAARDTDEGAAT